FLLALASIVTLASVAVAVAWRRFLALTMLVVCAYGVVHFSLIHTTPQFVPLWPRLELARREFVPSSELAKVSQFIRSAPSGTTFCFGHTGMESFFYNDLAETGKAWNYTVYSVTQRLPLRSADYRVRCDSALLPHYLFLFEWDGFPRKGVDAGCDITPLKSLPN
ncbi:MAG TPA: hypothetical protein VLC91_14470, partial [Spongiibacteraceae bacterium]|nr:hypothetical protein [Spongiibacteraceae bacterium]